METRSAQRTLWEGKPPVIGGSLHNRTVMQYKHPICRWFMMTSSNGNIFRVTGPLCREFTGPGELPAQRPVMRSFDVFFDLRPNKRLSKQPWGWWFETPSWSLWRQCNVKVPCRSCDASTMTKPYAYFMGYLITMGFMIGQPSAVATGLSRWILDAKLEFLIAESIHS